MIKSSFKIVSYKYKKSSSGNIVTEGKKDDYLKINSEIRLRIEKIKNSTDTLL